MKRMTVGIFLAVIILFAGDARGQNGPLTYGQLLTALSATLPRGFTKAKLNEKLIADVQKRGVDKSLTPDREDDLRQAGATVELIEAIRQHSPLVPTPFPTPQVIPQYKPKPTETSIYLPSMSELLKNAPKVGDMRKNSIGMEFMWIPPGSFMMGSDIGSSDEKLVHKITFSNGFWMGKFEVTQAQWLSVMGHNPGRFKDCGGNCPVESVNWDDAQEFIRKLNAKNDGWTYSLPSEAEWEYAARAGTTTAFAFGDSLNSSQANFDGNYPFNSTKGIFLQKTVQVGGYTPNAWGLYEMHGNVWEWVQDIYNSSYNNLPADGSANTIVGDSGFRVLRGGSWSDDADYARSANRDGVTPTNRYGNVGFRVSARLK